MGTKCRMTREAGFTVIELVTVVAIIAVMALAMTPLIGGLLSDSKTQGAARQVAAALRLAREHAIATAAPYRVALTSHTISIACASDCPPARPPDTTEPVATGATLTPPDNPISFSPRGAASPAGTVIVKHQDAVDWVVTVTPNGRVRACKSSCQ